MGYQYGGYQSRIRFGGQLTPAVKALLIANGAVFLVQMLLRTQSLRALDAFYQLFALTPSDAIGGLRVWQFITYSFLHQVGGALPLHIIFNMFLLWMFGGDVELALGRRRFLWLYFAATLAGGVCMIPWYHASILGASAAVFGVMAMYGRLFPDRRLLIWGIVPVKARTLVLMLAGLNLLMAMQGSQTGVAHLAHVGGFAVGWFFPHLEGVARSFIQQTKRRKYLRTEQQDKADEEKADQLLAKVGREGLGKLTRSERQFLNRASKKFRR